MIRKPFSKRIIDFFVERSESFQLLKMKVDNLTDDFSRLKEDITGIEYCKNLEEFV
jgi:hypothetical protein